MTIDEFLTDCETLPSIGPTMRRKLVALVRRAMEQRDTSSRLFVISTGHDRDDAIPIIRGDDRQLLAIIDGEEAT